jgi:predicted membrane protein (TIGR00267 family)
MEISNALKIARRYFVINAFDGAVTMLGAIMGAYISGIDTPRVLINIGFSVSIALATSGFVGSFLSEMAERRGEIRNLEKYLFRKLDNTMVADAHNFASVIVALVDALSPAVIAIIATMPFMLAHINIIMMPDAFKASVIVILTSTALLGFYLGKVSKAKVWLYMVIMVGAGLLTATLSLMLEGVLI